MARPSTTTNATEFLEFINQLGDDYCFDDFSDELWGLLWDFDATKKVWFVKPGKADYEFTLENDFGGYVQWQGKGEDPHNGDRDTHLVFLEWLKNRTSKTIICVVPNDKVEAAIAALKALGLEPTS